ncbi:MAG: rod shape-determining protein MreC [Bacillaceae bacterium]
MPQFFKNKRLIILLVCTIILVALVGYSLNRKSQLSWPEQFVKDAVSLVQSVVEKPAAYIAGFIDNIRDLRATYEENKVLKTRLDEYTELSVKVTELKKENEELKKTLKKTNTLSEYDTFQASVIMRNPDQWQEIITIDKGSDDGIKENMAVITADGLIGKVKNTAKFNSTVQLLSSTSRTNRVSAIVQGDDSIFGLIEGYDQKENVLLFKRIPSDVKVKKKQRVITSGLGGIFPRGLVIGEIVDVKQDKNGLTQLAYVKPAVNFHDINNVIVVERKARTSNEVEGAQ